MTLIMNLPVKPTLRDMVRVCLKLSQSTQPTFFIKLGALAASEECVEYRILTLSKAVAQVLRAEDASGG